MTRSSNAGEQQNGSSPSSKVARQGSGKGRRGRPAKLTEDDVEDIPEEPDEKPVQVLLCMLLLIEWTNSCT